MLVLDSGAVTRFAGDPRAHRRAQRVLLTSGTGRFCVPSPVLVECLTGYGPRDAVVNAFLGRCLVIEHVSSSLARRAALLRTRAGLPRRQRVSSARLTRPVR